jgi:hypothetical protein
MTTALLGHAALTGVLLAAFGAVVAVQWARPRCARVLRAALGLVRTALWGTVRLPAAVLRSVLRTTSRPAVSRS